jgi:outer membrane autotransporter protein
MSGDALGSFRTAGLSSAGHFVEQMSNRANPAGPSMQAEATPTQPIQLAYAGDISGLNFLQTMPASLHLWTRGVGIFDHTNANASLGSPSSEADTGGFQTGYDFSIGDTGLLGFSGGYSQTSLTVSDRSSSGNSDAAQFGVYGSYMPDSWIFDGSLAYSGASNANARTIAYHGINETAAASFHSNVYTAFGEAGYVFHPRPVVALEPSVSLRESHMLQEGYTESGAPGLDLTVGEQNSDSLVSSLGLRLSRLFEPQTSHPIGLGVRSAWQHELADVKNLITAQFADAPGAGFTVQSTPESRDAAALGLDVRAGLTKNLQAFANYTATLSSGQNIHSILGGFSLRW